MKIALIIWLLFLFLYISFNIYVVIRVLRMRIKGDLTYIAVLVYIAVIFLIIAAALILIGRLDWGQSIKLF